MSQLDRVMKKMSALELAFTQNEERFNAIEQGLTAQADALRGLFAERRENIKLECIKIAAGDVEGAEAMHGWITGRDEEIENLRSQLQQEKDLGAMHVAKIAELESDLADVRVELAGAMAENGDAVEILVDRTT